MNAGLLQDVVGLDLATQAWAQSPLDEGQLEVLADAAQALFADHSREEIVGLLRSCRKLERASRHKANPNIPSLGSRAELLEARILTNTLPQDTLPQNTPSQDTPSQNTPSQNTPLP